MSDLGVAPYCGTHGVTTARRARPHEKGEIVHGKRGTHSGEGCDVVRLVESRDADGRLLALLVVDECGDCDGEPATRYSGFDGGNYRRYDWKPCSSCAGRGWQPRAEQISRVEAVVPVPDLL